MGDQINTVLDCHKTRSLGSVRTPKSRPRMFDLHTKSFPFKSKQNWRYLRLFISSRDKTAE